MRLYTEGLLLKTEEKDWGKSTFLQFGESGRSRRLLRVFTDDSLASSLKTEESVEVAFVKTKSGSPRLVRKTGGPDLCVGFALSEGGAYHREADYSLMSVGGDGGLTSLVGVAKDFTKPATDFVRPVFVVAGVTAWGAAGNLGSFSDGIVLIPPGGGVTIQRDSRDPNSREFFFNVAGTLRRVEKRSLAAFLALDEGKVFAEKMLKRKFFHGEDEIKGESISLFNMGGGGVRFCFTLRERFSPTVFDFLEDPFGEVDRKDKVALWSAFSKVDPDATFRDGNRYL